MKTNKPRKQLFIIEYLKDKNATNAAIRAGYSKKTARVQGPRLLQNVDVKRAINQAIEAQGKRMLKSADDVLRELERIGFTDLRKLFDDNGALLPVKEWPEDEARAVAGIDVDELYGGKGADRENVGITKRLKLWNKVDALKALAQHHKLLTGEGDTSVKDITEMLGKIAELLK